MWDRFDGGLAGEGDVVSYAHFGFSGDWQRHASKYSGSPRKLRDACPDAMGGCFNSLIMSRP